MKERRSKQMRRPRILVVGSFVMDQIASTAVFPREGQTVLGEAFSKAPGGKGANQSVQAARLGADVTMLGKLGRDANGQEMLRTMKEAGVDTSHVLYDEEKASGCAVIILEQTPGKATKNRIIVIPGSNMTITDEEVAFLKDGIREYDMVMLQLEIPMAVNERVASYAREAGVPVMLNSAPSAPLSDKFLADLTYISPNEHEAADITGIAIDHTEEGIDMAAVREACEALRAKGVSNGLITLGSAGAAMLNENGFFVSPCCNGIDVVDPTAAGDSFVGAFCTAVCCGLPMEDVLKFANYTAALTVSRLGAMPSLPTIGEVLEFMKGRGESIPGLSCLTE